MPNQTPTTPNPNPYFTTQNGISGIQYGNQFTNIAYADPSLVKLAGGAPGTSAPQPAPITAPAQPAPITATGLTQTQQPITLPTTPTNTAALAAAAVKGNAQSAFGNQVDNAFSGTDALLGNGVNTATNDVNTYKSAVNDLITQYGDQSADQTNAENAAGIPTLRANAKNLTDQYNQNRLTFNNQYQAVVNDMSLSADQKARQISALQNEHAYSDSNLFIQQSIAQGDYQAAQEQVDKQINIKYGNIKDRIGFAQDFLKTAEDKLSTKETAQIQSQIEKDKSKLAEVTYQTHALQDVKTNLQQAAATNGAPQNVISAIQGSEDIGSAMAHASGYLRDHLDDAYKNAQIQNIYQGIANSKLDNQVKLLTISGASQSPGTRPIGNPDPQSGAYATRATSAASLIDNLSSEFSQRTAQSLLSGATPAFLRTQDQKQFEQAKKNFATAVLRRESGASISNTEFNDMDTVYFPQPGDSEQVLNQKANARVAAINGLIGSAGRAYNGTYLPPVPLKSADQPITSYLVKTAKGSSLDLSTFEH